MGGTAASGAVGMRYAHLCLGVTEELIFATIEHVMSGVIVPARGAGRFPVPSMLASAFVAYGGAPGPRELMVAFTDNRLNILNGTTGPLEFKAREPGYPVTAHQALELEDMGVPGPGVYYFDFIVEGVHVGRLPLMMIADTPDRKYPTDPLQLGRFARPGIMLDWGHLLDRFEQHPDGTLTLHHVYEVWPVLTNPSEPFEMDAKLLLQLSAPASFAGEHRLAVRAHDADGELIGDVAGGFTLAPIFPGRVTGWQWVDLKTLGFPSIGDYTLEVLADDDRIGSIDVFARAARFEPK
jgi:hypothetical protein